MCVHKDKRKVLIPGGKSALIHKSSVNLINKDPKFSSPYFVFGEKVGGDVSEMSSFNSSFLSSPAEDACGGCQDDDHGGAHPPASVWLQLCGLPRGDHHHDG